MTQVVIVAEPDGSVVLKCPHCGAAEVFEHDLAVRWNPGEFSLTKDGVLRARWSTDGDADFDSDGYICGSCLSQELELPKNTDHTYW